LRTAMQRLGGREDAAAAALAQHLHGGYGVSAGDGACGRADHECAEQGPGAPRRNARGASH
jgi:hypothetical protein